MKKQQKCLFQTENILQLPYIGKKYSLVLDFNFYAVYSMSRCLRKINILE